VHEKAAIYSRFFLVWNKAKALCKLFGQGASRKIDGN
jgi:hypothetical protein